MDALSPINLLVAFAAGTLSFLSPCMLPLVPGYLAVLGTDEEGQRSRVRAAAWFVAGFAVVFVLLGMGSGLAGGGVLRARRPLELTGGVLIALFGALILAERILPASMQRRLGRELRPPRPGRTGAMLFGAVFGAAWSPCIGPTLGAILTLAATSGSIVSGATLLGVFAAGLGIPFLLLAAGAGWLERSLVAVRRYAHAIRIASGVLLLTFGMLLALGVVGQLSSRLASIPGLDI